MRVVKPGSSFVVALMLILFGTPSPAAQEERAPADTLAADTLATDTLGADTLAAEPGDTLAADTIAALDTLPRFPFPGPSSVGVEAHWGLADLLASGALTPGDVLEHVPQLTPIRLGFVEGPQAALFAGGGAAGLRVEVDGYRLAPLGGGPLDLHTISLVEQEDFVLAREPGGYRLLTRTYRRRRPEAYSRIEGGTGDRDANILRGLFASTFAGNAIGFGFDRVDTRGVAELGGMERTGIWARVLRPLPAGLVGELELRSSSADRDSFPSPRRRDWVLRLRRPFSDGWSADLIAGTAELEDRAPAGAPDSLAGGPTFDAQQLALRVGRGGERWSAFGSLRFWGGDGVPQLESEGGLELGLGPAAVYGRAHHASWEDFSTLSGYVTLRLALPLGLTAVAELEDGDRGLIAGAPIEREFFTRWTVGGELARERWSLAVRGGRWRVEDSPALSAPFDSSTALPGGTSGVIETSGRARLFRLFDGWIEFEGAYRSREAGRFLYWPQDDWRLGGRYHTVLRGGQLEIKLRVLGGLRGPMLVPDPQAPTTVFLGTEDLNWFWSEAVVRIRDVHVFLTYEAFGARLAPREFPGVPLPRARTHFGLKWEFLN